MNRRAKVRPMTPGISRSARVRAYVAAAVLSLGLGGVAYKAYALQVGEGERFREVAEKQHVMSVEVPAPRGEIVDRAGRPLAVTADVDSVWANPREIRDVTGTAEKLAQLLEMEEPDLEAKLAGDRHFVWLRRHVKGDVAEAMAAAIKGKQLPGVYMTREPRRWYPGRELAGPVLGRADIDGHGVEGVELSLDEQLTGKRGQIAALRDAHGRAALAEGLAPSEPGATVELTLDRTIQQITEDALFQAVSVNKAKSGEAIVLDVQTSQVLAIANWPTFDPNATGARDGARDKVVTDAVEIGSLMKVFSVITALDAGVVSPDTMFDVRSSPYHFTDAHHDTELSTAGVIKRSSNIGASKIAAMLGKERLYAGLRNFGFGGKVGVELPGEAAGVMRKGATWRDIELATISFGYGLTVTPLQVAAGIAAIGNDGMYRAPRIVSKITGADGRVVAQPEDQPRRVVKARTAAQMRAMMALVFERSKQSGTAHNVVVPGFVCGGKTGTAYKYDHTTHHYATDRYLSSFAGLAPIDNPRLAVVVLIDDPSGESHFGGDVAAPAFATIASESLRYLGVPGNALPVAPAAKPTPGAKPAPAAAADDDDREEPAVIAAPGEIDDPELTMIVPSLLGMGAARIVDLARTNGWDLQLAGAGRVVKQDPPPGRYAPGTTITVELGDDDHRRTSGAATLPKPAK